MAAAMRLFLRPWMDGMPALQEQMQARCPDAAKNDAAAPAGSRTSLSFGAIDDRRPAPAATLACARRGQHGRSARLRVGDFLHRCSFDTHGVARDLPLPAGGPSGLRGAPERCAGPLTRRAHDALDRGLDHRAAVQGRCIVGIDGVAPARDPFRLGRDGVPIYPDRILADADDARARR